MVVRVGGRGPLLARTLVLAHVGREGRRRGERRRQGGGGQGGRRRSAGSGGSALLLSPCDIDHRYYSTHRIINSSQLKCLVGVTLVPTVSGITHI